MSGQYTDNISPEDLLMEISVDQISSPIVQDALGEYQRFIYKLRVKRDAYEDLNRTVVQMRAWGKADTDEYRESLRKYNLCVEELEILDKQRYALESREPLKTLYKQLYQKKSAESKAGDQRIQEQRRLQKEQEYTNHTKSSIRMTKQDQLREIAVHLHAVEKKIPKLQNEIHQIEDDISSIPFAFFGEKLQRKRQLQRIHADLSNQLAALKKRQSQLYEEAIELGVLNNTTK